MWGAAFYNPETTQVGGSICGIFLSQFKNENNFTGTHRQKFQYFPDEPAYLLATRMFSRESCSPGLRAVNVPAACFRGHTWASGRDSLGSLWSQHPDYSRSCSPPEISCSGQHSLLPAFPSHQGPGASTTDGAGSRHVF